jgi:hypothetical protein
MERLNNKGSGNSKPIIGFAKAKSMKVGDVIAGKLNGMITTKGQFPKLNYLIELAQPFTFTTYSTESQSIVTVNANVGDVVAVETVSTLSKDISEETVGQNITIVHEGKGKPKAGQKAPYLLIVYKGLPESAKPAAGGQQAATGRKAGFPFNS